MPKELVGLTAGIAAVLVGLILVLQPNLIDVIPKTFHYVLGIVAIGLGAMVIYYVAK